MEGTSVAARWALLHSPGPQNCAQTQRMGL